MLEHLKSFCLKNARNKTTFRININNYGDPPPGIHIATLYDEETKRKSNNE